MVQPISLDVDDQLAAAFVENKELKSRLRDLEVAHQDLKFECNFHIVKAAELRDVVEARTRDEIHEKLVSKALHNAELCHELEKVNAVLNESKTEIGAVSKEREKDKLILLQLSDIVRTLQLVPLDYEKVDALTEFGGSQQEASLANIRRKIEAMVEDRQKIIETCKWLRDENVAKDSRIQELETKLSSQNVDTNFQGVPMKPRQHHGPNEGPPSPEPTYLSESTSPSTPSSCMSSIGIAQIVDFNESNNEEIQTLKSQLGEVNERCEDMKKELQMAVDNASSHEHANMEEISRLKDQLDQANKRYEDLKNEWQKGSLKLELVERKLEESEASMLTTRSKRDSYKNHLKDVIDQYKALHVLHNASLAKINYLNIITVELTDDKQKILLEKELLEKEKATWMRERAEMTNEKDILMDDMKNLVDEKQRLTDEKGRLIEEKETLTETQSILLEEKKILNQENESLINENKQIAERYGDEKTIAEFQDEISCLAKKNKALIEDNKKLTGEEKTLREEMDSWMESHEKHYEESIADYLEAESADLPALQQAYLAAAAKISIAERKQSIAAKELESFQQQKTQKDRNLRDVISKHKKMERCLDMTLQELEDAKSDLKKAKIEADRQKEEAKHARRRLTGCLRQVKKLQEDQNEARATIASLKADQHKRWNDGRWTKESMHKMILIEATVTAQAWRTQRELQVEYNLLVRERNELKAFCEDVLNEVGSQESDVHPAIMAG